MEISVNEKDRSLKAKLGDRMEKIFQGMACKEPKKAVHSTAAAAAAIVAFAPIGVDAWLLRLAEVLMLVSIYSHYGVKLTRAAAESLLSGAFCQAVGENAALAALEAADVAAMASGGIGAPVALGICTSVAVGLVEAVGHLTIRACEGDKAACAIIHLENVLGGAADASRLIKAVEPAIASIAPNDPVQALTKGSAISFTGTTALQGGTGKYGGMTTDQILRSSLPTNEKAREVAMATYGNITSGPAIKTMDTITRGHL